MSEGAMVVAPTWRARIADPKPAFCSGCLRGADVDTKFVDLGMPIERGFLRDLNSQAVVAELNRLCLCESCVREMSECLSFSPEIHQMHQMANRRLEEERKRLSEENKMLRRLVADGLLEEREKSGARRK